MVYCQEGGEGTEPLQANIKATWAAITLELCPRPIAAMPHFLEAVINADGGPTKY